MKRFVYELINLMGTIEYVGETCNPKERFYKHTKVISTKYSGCGKFYGRTDISMNIVKEFDNRKDALNLQYELQKEYGFKADREQLLGRTHSIETKLMMSKNRIGKGIGKRAPFTEEHKEKLRKPKTEEHKQKLREAKLGKIRGPYKTII